MFWKFEQRISFGYELQNIQHGDTAMINNYTYKAMTEMSLEDKRRLVVVLVVAAAAAAAAAAVVVVVVVVSAAVVLVVAPEVVVSTLAPKSTCSRREQSCYSSRIMNMYC